MSRLRCVLVLLPVLLVLSAGPTSAAEQLLPPVVVTGDPVAPSPSRPGPGLCSTSRISTNPALDFPQSTSTFQAGLNAFLEAAPDSANPNARVTSVLRTGLDLSNNNASGTRLSYGDFVSAVSGCPTGGCGFFVNDTTTSFATRLRGYLDVTQELVGVPVHFGLYADDAVALVLYDRGGLSYTVINRAPQLGFATWRTTNSVTFVKPGLYPIEVLYAEITEHAALELSMFKGTFTDFERPANQPPVVSLANEGFILVTADMFHQSESGRPSSSDPEQCTQCDRRDANTEGNAGCGSGFHCNAAALCTACDSERFCGDSCSPCGTGTPFCVSQTKGHACVECREDADCAAPDACHVGVCDATGSCSFPVVPDGTTCPGGTCQAGLCLPSDAGSPGGGDGGASPDGGGVSGDGGAAPGDGGSGVDGGAESPDASLPDAGTLDGSTPGADGGVTGGEPDAGGGSDAGTEPGNDGGSAGGGGQPMGCGCGAGVPSLAPLSVLGLALLVRRARRVSAGPWPCRPAGFPPPAP